VIVTRQDSQLSANRCPQRRRKGAVVVELALISPFLILLLLGICEIGQTMRAEAMLVNAARRGCAAGSRVAGTNADVMAEIRASLEASKLPVEAATIRIRVEDRAMPVESAVRNNRISVTVSLPTSEVMWTGGNWFIGTSSQQTQTVTMLRQN
jgi:Flp pilus assembly protein TadG